MRKITNEELQRVSVTEIKKLAKLPVVIVADNLRSLNNIGSLFRTADAFIIEKIYLCGICATPPNREIHKTALGAELTVEWEYNKETIDVVKKLKSNGYTAVAIEQVEGAIPLNNFTPEMDKKYAIILGNEVNGVQQEVIDICDVGIEIPQSGTKHSLNVSVAAGVVLWSFYKEFIN